MEGKHVYNYIPKLSLDEFLKLKSGPQTYSRKYNNPVYDLHFLPLH